MFTHSLSHQETAVETGLKLRSDCHVIWATYTAEISKDFRLKSKIKPSKITNVIVLAFQKKKILIYYAIFCSVY